uniref:Uncharacterized protein n=1 Tax=Rhizophora mucronata TaxID=61149 RepID=A0A2P2Q773_RHIMU
MNVSMTYIIIQTAALMMSCKFIIFVTCLFETIVAAIILHVSHTTIVCH